MGGGRRGRLYGGGGGVGENHVIPVANGEVVVMGGDLPIDIIQNRYTVMGFYLCLLVHGCLAKHTASIISI
jgi:hypothetical protein